MRDNSMSGYRFAKIFIWPIFRLLYRPTIIGKGKIPKKGPVVIACNHMHDYDPVVIGCATSRPIHFMSKVELHQGKFKWFFKLAGTIPVNREIHDEAANQKALEVLKNGWAFGIFPEGTRNKTNDLMMPFKYGAVSFAKKTNAVIVPCALVGRYRYKNNHLTLKVGDPYKIESDDLEVEREKLQGKVRELLLELRKLKNIEKLEKEEGKVVNIN